MVLIDQALLALPVHRKTLTVSQFTFFNGAMTYYGTTGLNVLSKHLFHLLLDQEYQLDQGNL